MSIARKNKKGRLRRAYRVRNRLRRDGNMLRVSVFRSLNNIYAQLIDDTAGKTLVSCSSLELKDLSGDKKNVAKSVGLEFAKRAQDQKVTSASFDRGRFRYHGRVKALVEGMREGGLQI